MACTDRARAADKPRSRSFPARGKRHNQARPASRGSRANKKEPASPVEIASAAGIEKAPPDFSRAFPDLAVQLFPIGTSLEGQEWLEICAARSSNISTPCRNERSGCSECSAETRDSPCPDRTPGKTAYGCRG